MQTGSSIRFIFLFLAVFNYSINLGLIAHAAAPNETASVVSAPSMSLPGVNTIKNVGPKTKDGVFIFPAHFKWCVATAAHQIEGSNTNSDWWAFEQVTGNVAKGDKSGMAADHWNRVEADTKLMKELNVNAYRFSIEWAKIEPQQGQWNKEAIEHYRNEIQVLRSHGIKPLITLHHFTLPQWVVKKGSWLWSDFPQAFKKYTEVVISEIAPDVQDWMTFNEPMVIISGDILLVLCLQK